MASGKRTVQVSVDNCVSAKGEATRSRSSANSKNQMDGSSVARRAAVKPKREGGKTEPFSESEVMECGK